MTTTAALLLLAAIAIPVTAGIAMLQNRVEGFAELVNRTFRDDE